MKKYLIGFLIGFLIGPIAVVEGFGYYTQLKIEKIDKQNAIQKALNENGYRILSEERKVIEDKHKFMGEHPSYP